MGEVVQLDDPWEGLPKPRWFYAECERLTNAIFDGYGEMLNNHPTADIAFDDVWHAIEETPTRVMALAQGDDEAETFLAHAGMFRAIVGRMGKPGRPLQ